MSNQNYTEQCSRYPWARFKSHKEDLEDKMVNLDNEDLVVELSMHETKYMTIIKSIKNEEVFIGLSDENHQQATIEAIKKLYRELQEERNIREKILDRIEDVINGK